ncbi:hypothetical protein BDZ94DRAFT_1291870 [Collybia nuda]|uniref:Fibronectin type-III domain-containing protein n=1 Tax=Collybia nuda TaxID=64659 RepID=A0A9P5XW62_9AGAR|nr:hypothetical protein BDZ94DRAFT_1291870 [Collybia nuda]
MMATTGQRFSRALPLLFTLSLLWPATGVYSFTNTPHLVQSFFFDYNLPTQPVPVPTTAQCEKIHITWSRSSAIGPNPTAPYYLQVYTSTFVFPFIIEAGSGLSFDWAVPFTPGTQYQICMFDRYGNTGGCQATYTVIPPAPTDSISCPNVTFPQGPLDVEAVVINGPMSQYGWIDQCTDISVTPKNGTPPYIFTIAPALHPPFNITSLEMKTMNWTVSLSWASPFFISVADSMGNFWANGPLHSGGNGPKSCLSGTDSRHVISWAVSPVFVGTSVGGAVVGALLGIAATSAFLQKRRHKRHRSQFVDLNSGSPGGSPTEAQFDHPVLAPSSHYSAVPSGPGYAGEISIGSSNPSSNTMLHRMTIGSGNYQVEPFVMPTEEGRRAIPQQASSVIDPNPQAISPRESSSNHVYVVHHDGGRAPVSVYHQDGTEVVELPPRYVGSDGRSEGRSEGYGSSDRPSEIRSESGRSDATEHPVFLRQSRNPGPTSKPRATALVDSTS